MSTDRKKISSDEFVSIWKNYTFEENNDLYTEMNGKLALTFLDYEIQGSIHLPIIEADYQQIKLVNCKIGKITISESRIGSIWIDKSQIDALEIRRARLNDIYILNSSFVEGILFDNKTTIGSFIILGKSSVDTISINNESELLSINISEKSQVDYLNIVSSSKCGSISIRDSSINWSFWISVNSKTGNISIDETSHINQFSILYASSVGKIVINNKSTVNALTIVNSVAEHIQINTKCQLGEIQVIEQSNLISITISNSFVGRLLLKESIISNIEIDEDSKLFELQLYYLKEQSRRLTIHKSFIQKFNINVDKQYQINIANSTIWILDFIEKILPRDFILSVSDTSFNSMLFKSFINQGTILFSNICSIDKETIYKLDLHKVPLLDENTMYVFEEEKKESVIKIINSDLGKVNFIESRLDKFAQFVFSNSKILDIFFTNTTLPNINIITAQNEDNNNEYLKQRRLALSQIKKIYENRGDIVRATKYHAYEMETYRESLNKRIEHRFSSKWRNNKAERFNLWLNRFSNDYGNNWLSAVAVTLGVNFVLYTLYCFSLGFRFGNSYSIFGDLFSYSFDFLNPIRKADFAMEVNNIKVKATALSRFVDSVSRIILAYLVYQTIAAFRKFGKKST